MTVIDPGHEYILDSLDGELIQKLVFVKREGEKYPGNVGSHPGTTTQEVLRALIERCQYVNKQSYCYETAVVIERLITALLLLECRAARLHERAAPTNWVDVVAGKGKCNTCGHIGCPGTCRHNMESSE